MGFFATKGDEPTGKEPLNINRGNNTSKFNVIAGVIIVIVLIIIFIFFV